MTKSSTEATFRNRRPMLLRSARIQRFRNLWMLSGISPITKKCLKKAWELEGVREWDKVSAEAKKSGLKRAVSCPSLGNSKAELFCREMM